MTKSECRFTVRYCETGEMGFAHHSRYFDWFDLAQEALLADTGVSYGSLENKGYRVLPVSNSCDFKTPARYGDKLTARIYVADVSGVRLKFDYEIVRERDSALIARGHTEHIIVDRGMRPIIVKRAIPELFSKLSGE